MISERLEALKTFVVLIDMMVLVSLERCDCW